jgi:hypothetical protein
MNTGEKLNANFKAGKFSFLLVSQRHFPPLQIDATVGNKIQVYILFKKYHIQNLN